MAAKIDKTKGNDDIQIGGYNSDVYLTSNDKFDLDITLNSSPEYRSAMTKLNMDLEKIQTYNGKDAKLIGAELKLTKSTTKFKFQKPKSQSNGNDSTESITHKASETTTFKSGTSFGSITGIKPLNLDDSSSENEICRKKSVATTSKFSFK